MANVDDAKKDTRNDENVTAEEAKTHVTEHLDRDLNDPRNVAPASNLPSLDHESQQGPEHGRIGNEGDHSAKGQDFVNLDEDEAAKDAKDKK